MSLGEAGVNNVASNDQPGSERIVPASAAAAAAEEPGLGRRIGSVVVEAEIEGSKRRH